jgi:lipoate-protein ligase A
MGSWQLIRTPDQDGRQNMQLDLELFQAFEKSDGPSILRFYSWQPQCVSLGYSQKIEAEIDLAKAMELKWEIVKRPTGGGIVFHNEAEITYSLVTAIDNPLLPKGMVPSYKKISEAIVLGLQYMGIKAEVKSTPVPRPSSLDPLCFSYPAEYEVVYNGRKIVGSAQKRGRRALLQQGSIFVRDTDPSALLLLKQPAKEYNAVSVEEILGRTAGFLEIASALQQGFEECFKIELKS